MVNKSIGILLLLFSSGMAHPQKNTEMLQTRIDSLINRHIGTFGVAFRDLQTSETLFINGEVSFHAASTMKTPVMTEVFRQVEEGIFSLQDSVVVRNSFKSIVDGAEYSMELGEDSDDGLYKFLGKKVTVKTLVDKMITVSSNLSTNILIEMVGAKNVMATMRRSGLHDITVLRGVEDDKAYAAGLNNTTTPKDLMLLFEAIAKKTILTEKSCDQMLEILFAQVFKEMIPAKLPANVKVAHKTGSITNVQHDSGIIYLPDGRKYVLVVLSKDLGSNRDGIAVIAQISKMIYEFMTE